MQSPAVSQFDPRLAIEDIVLAHPECARVFRALRIDFWGDGRLTLREAVARNGLPLEQVQVALATALHEPAHGGDRHERTVVPLIAYIVDRHHGFIRNVMPGIVSLADRIAQGHGCWDPSWVEVAAVARELDEELEHHLADEERYVFPSLIAQSCLDPMVRRQVAVMHHDHDAIQQRIERLRALTDGYQPAADACENTRRLFDELRRLDDDLAIHLDLEEHVLWSHKDD